MWGGGSKKARHWSGTKRERRAKALRRGYCVGGGEHEIHKKKKNTRQFWLTKEKK